MWVFLFLSFGEMVFFGVLVLRLMMLMSYLSLEVSYLIEGIFTVFFE